MGQIDPFEFLFLFWRGIYNTKTIQANDHWQRRKVGFLYRDAIEHWKYCNDYKQVLRNESDNCINYLIRPWYVMKKIKQII